MSTTRELQQKIICVTGPMAAGKNAASAILEEQGWLSIDADRTAHEAIENCRQIILETFGPEAAKQNITLTNEDGTINRRALAPILFSDPALLAKQEAIVHPEVVRLINTFIASHADSNIIINATVLHKTPDLMVLCQAILYIDAPLITRLRRARSRDGLSTSHILKRFHSQRTLYRDYKATGTPIYRVSNGGTRQQLQTTIENILKKL